MVKRKKNRIVILSSVKAERIIKAIRICPAKFMKPVCRHGGGTEDMRQNFPLLGFFPLFTDTYVKPFTTVLEH